MDTNRRWIIYRWIYRLFTLLGLIMLLAGMLLSLINSPAQAGSLRTIAETATVRPPFVKQPGSKKPVQLKGSNRSNRPEVRSEGVGLPPVQGNLSLQTAQATLAPGTGSVRFLAPDTAICMLGAGTLTATVEVSLPAGVSAILQTTYRIAEPPDLRTAATYSETTVQNGDTVSVSGAWPGVRPGDQVVEVHFGAVLLDPSTHNPISNGAGVDYYWYPWVCNVPPTAPPPTVEAGFTATVTSTATQTTTSQPPTVEAGQTDTPTPTATLTEFPTAVEATEVTITATSTATFTATATGVPTSTATATMTETERPPTVEAGQTSTATPTVTFTATSTLTETSTATATATEQPPTVVVGLTSTSTSTATATVTLQPSSTNTVTSTATATASVPPPTVEAGYTSTATVTPTQTPTSTPTTAPPTVTANVTATNTPPTTITVEGPTAVSPSEIPTLQPSETPTATSTTAPSAAATLQRPSPIVIVITATSGVPVTGGGQPTTSLGAGETATTQPTVQSGPLQAPSPGSPALVPVTGADLAHQPLSTTSLPFWQRLTTYTGLFLLGIGLIMQGLAKKS